MNKTSCILAAVLLQTCALASAANQAFSKPWLKISEQLQGAMPAAAESTQLASTPAPVVKTNYVVESTFQKFRPASHGETGAKWRPMTRREFVATIWPHARRAAKVIGVPVHALVAQAALETGWGRHLARDNVGKSGFNLFGIKAGTGWFGGRSRLPTHEVVNGVVAREDASFRGYDTVAEAFDDYVAFLRRNPRYAAALREGTTARFAAGLQKAGYSTDPHYADKIHQIANSRLLRIALRGGAGNERALEIAMSEFTANPASISSGYWQQRTAAYHPGELPNVRPRLNPFD